MGYAFGSIDELGEGPGFRKVRRALGVTAFGVNAIVFPPGFVGFNHFHETQDELYFVHRAARAWRSGTRPRARPGRAPPRGVDHAAAGLERSEDEELVLLVVGGSGGYVERDGQMVDPADIERRHAFSS